MFTNLPILESCVWDKRHVDEEQSALTNEGKKRKCIGKLSSRFRWKGCFRNCRRWPVGPRQRLQSLLLPFVSPIIALNILLDTRSTVSRVDELNRGGGEGRSDSSGALASLRVSRAFFLADRKRGSWGTVCYAVWVLLHPLSSFARSGHANGRNFGR